MFLFLFFFQKHHPIHHSHFQHDPYQHQPYFRPPPVYARPPLPPYGPPKPPSFLGNLFGFGDKNDNLPPTTASDEGLFDPLLKLVGLKNSEQPSVNEIGPDLGYLSQYHDPLEYDYGDYLEGYQNYVKPQRPKTVPERIARWFTGFRIPSAKKVSFL